MEHVFDSGKGHIFAEVKDHQKAEFIVQGYVGLGRLLDFMAKYMPLPKNKLDDLLPRLTLTTERIWDLFVDGGGISSRGKLALLSEHHSNQEELQSLTQGIEPGITLVRGRSRPTNSYVLVAPGTSRYLVRGKVNQHSQLPSEFYINQQPLPALVLEALGTHLSRTKAIREVTRAIRVSPMSLAGQALIDVVNYRPKTRGVVEK